MMSQSSLRVAASAALLTALAVSGAGAYHPLVTDDTGTQGKGGFQFEHFADFHHERESGVRSDTFIGLAQVSAGIGRPVDLVVAGTYVRSATNDNGTTARECGAGDVLVEVKWRALEWGGASVALKPSVYLPSADDGRGLGPGRARPSLFLIGTRKNEKGEFHANAAYTRNENKAGERKDIWRASASAGIKVASWLKVVYDIVVSRNPDAGSKLLVTSVIGGVVFSPCEHFDLDVGVEKGITKPATDLGILTGVTWRF